MDRKKALKIEKILKDKRFEQYIIEQLLDNGKSAAVFKATNLEGDSFAIKVFDNDLVERFGHDIQEKRIKQEISLKNHGIKNLVKIIDGGETQIDNEKYYFIVMEYVSGKNLKEFIKKENYDISTIAKIGMTLLEVSEALLSKDIAHRDIKPENVMIDDDSRVTLMDLGVLKFISMASFTDGEEKQFLGTLRYAPPEFLDRTEANNVDGWRAVNLYQIGGVLHDLITKSELFCDYSPYGNLVKLS